MPQMGNIWQPCFTFAILSDCCKLHAQIQILVETSLSHSGPHLEKLVALPFPKRKGRWGCEALPWLNAIFQFCRWFFAALPIVYVILGSGIHLNHRFCRFHILISIICRTSKFRVWERWHFQINWPSDHMISTSTKKYVILELMKPIDEFWKPLIASLCS